MSLFDAVLRDGVLNPPVMQQNYYIAIRSDEAFGSGTFDDPWNGSTQTFFDAAMSLVPENSTVFLGPCTFTSSGSPDKVFETKGFPTAGGFRVKSGQRIVGSGMETTIVRLKDHSAGAPNHVFGMPVAGTL